MQVLLCWRALIPTIKIRLRRSWDLNSHFETSAGACEVDADTFRSKYMSGDADQLRPRCPHSCSAFAATTSVYAHLRGLQACAVKHMLDANIEGEL